MDDCSWTTIMYQAAWKNGQEPVESLGASGENLNFGSSKDLLQQSL